MLSSVFTTAVNHNPSHGFSGTTFVPWDNEAHENPLIYLTQEPDLSFSGSDDSTPKINSSNSGSDDDPIDDRKRRRMISNRESARRSRMRKQKHLENLINLLNRHKSGNRELMNRLLLALYHGHALKQENERLRSESVMLRQKLWDLHQVIRASQIPNELSSSAWPCNNNNNNNEASSKNKTNRH